MAEKEYLNELLERINRDYLRQAETRRDEAIAEAEKQAASLIENAKKQAAETVAAAEKQAAGILAPPQVLAVASVSSADTPFDNNHDLKVT